MVEIARQQENLFDDPALPAAAKTTDESVTKEFHVLTLPSYKVGKTGVPYCKFLAKDTQAPFDSLQIVAFKAGSEQAKKLEVGKKFTVTGKYDSKDERVFIMFSLYIPGEKVKRQSLLYQLAREEGSLENYRAKREETHEAMKRAGMVPIYGAPIEGDVAVVNWHQKKQCIFDGGKWKRKIDFICDKLGVEVVRLELKAVTKDCAIILTKEKEGAFAFPSAPWIHAYRDWMDRKVSELLLNDGPLFN